MTERTVRVLLAEHHQLIRQHLRRLLEEQPGWRVVADAADGQRAVHLVEAHRPDIAVVGLGTPGLNGIEVTRRIRERSPATRVVVYSIYSEDAYLEAAWRAGASGFVAADSADVDLVPAIHEVRFGRHFVSAIVSPR